MKEITREMIRMYGLKDSDFMGYHLIKSDATFHHIIKKENGGKEIIENGAVLMPVPHSYLHIIESKEYKYYEAINTILKITNKRGYLDKEDLKIISEILHLFEEEHIKEKTGKGRTLIKQQYKERIYY